MSRNKQDCLDHGVVEPCGYHADRDTLRFRFRWYLEGKVQPFAPTSVAVPVRALKAGQTWWCGVAGYDGRTEGEEGRSSRRTIRDGTGGP